VGEGVAGVGAGVVVDVAGGAGVVVDVVGAELVNGGLGVAVVAFSGQSSRRQIAVKFAVMLLFPDMSSALKTTARPSESSEMKHPAGAPSRDSSCGLEENPTTPEASKQRVASVGKDAPGTEQLEETECCTAHLPHPIWQSMFVATATMSTVPKL
jgi:hypothetical protein